MAIQPERMLTVLAGDLAVLKEGFGALVERIGKLEGKDPSTSIAGIHEALADILESIEELRPGSEEEDGPPPTPNWATADQDRARELWKWLTDWCRSTLHPMYAREHWRPCWYEHPQLRIQLTWLAHFHDWAYEPKAPPPRAAEWHLRWWPQLRDQILIPEFEGCGHKDASKADRVMLHEVPIEEDQMAFEDGGLHEYIDEFVKLRPTKAEMAKKSG
ncbi:hypothetical protein AB0424_28525 [Streptomyces sp. NPDC051180]|uniref:hypothetical protein n=1 Tax=unclassified Streptomyces TaxID=2593676 RepID=UPI00344FAB63